MKEGLGGDEGEDGERGREVVWRRHRINLAGSGVKELRVVEIDSLTELTEIPGDMWQGVVFLDKKLNYKRREERDYLIIDADGSDRYLRIEDKGGKLLVFEGTKSEKEYGPCYEDQTSSWTVVSFPEMLSIFYSSNEDRFTLFGGTKRGR